MSDVLAARIAQPDLVGLPEWQVAEILNAPDAQLVPVPAAFSCRAIAAPAVISGELELLRHVHKIGRIPADVSPTGQAVDMPTRGLIAIGTVLDAVNRDLQVDPSMPGAADKIQANFDAIEQMGLLSAATKAVILAQTVRHPSWAEANQIEVTALSVSQAKGG